jgi:hypothetical protein
VYVTKIDYSPAFRNRDIGLLRCGMDMDSSSFPRRVSWVENINCSLTVSPVCVNNKGGVIIPLFEYISICYVKQLEWAAVVEVCELHRMFCDCGAEGRTDERSGRSGRNKLYLK